MERIKDQLSLSLSQLKDNSGKRIYILDNFNVKTTFSKSCALVNGVLHDGGNINESLLKFGA